MQQQWPISRREQYHADNQHQDEIYQACVLSILLYGSESWTLYSCQEGRLNAFYMRCLKKIQGIVWQDHVTNKDVLVKAKIPTIFGLLSLRRLRWLWQVIRMQDGRIPKHILYGRLETGIRQTDRPPLHLKDVGKRSIKLSSINPAECDSWSLKVKSSVQLSEETRLAQWEDKRRRQQLIAKAVVTNVGTHTCSNCNRKK